MRNNIASFEESRRSEVKIWAKSNAKINSTSIFLQIVTPSLIDFSKEAILFLIYLLADKDKRNTITYKVPKKRNLKFAGSLWQLKNPR